MVDLLSGAALYADVQRYDSFGLHRYGSPGAERALAWIEAELENAGLNVSSQPFSLARQCGAGLAGADDDSVIARHADLL